MESALPGPGHSQREVAVPLRVVEHVEAHRFEVGNARRQKRSAPMTQRGSKTALADFLFILSSSPARCHPTPLRQSTVFTEREAL